MTERFSSAAERLAKIAFRSNTWREVTATVESSTYRPHLLPSEQEGEEKLFEVTFSYTVNGAQFVDKYRRSEPLDVGHEITILYNPSKPRQNNLSGTEASTGFRILMWIAAAIFAALLIYFTEHFDLRDH